MPEAAPRGSGLAPVSDRLKSQVTHLSQLDQALRTAVAEVAMTLREAAGAKTPGARERVLDDAIAKLEALLRRPEPPERQCSVCGLPENENMGYLIDATVLVADGEEGYAWIKQLLCESHFPAIQQIIIDAGFVDHRHGGMNYLEDPHCPGYEDHEACPTPWLEDEDQDPYDRPLLVRPRVNGEPH